MAFTLQARVTRALNRVHASIDARCDDFLLACAQEHETTRVWLHERAVFYARSIGQLTRFERARSIR
jgi:hypothetical protein